MSTGAYFDTTSDFPLSPFHTLDDLARRFGDLPLERILQSPLPGTATEHDALRLPGIDFFRGRESLAPANSPYETRVAAKDSRPSRPSRPPDAAQEKGRASRKRY